MRVRIEYVDGTSTEGDAEDWPRLRSDGVDRVNVAGIWIAGHSLYWLRREDGGYSAGAASFYPNPLFGVFISDEGVQTERDIEFVPDLRHDEVKLGWWWRGEDLAVRHHRI